MKQAVLFTLFFSFILAGCSKKPEQPAPPPAVPAPVTQKVLSQDEAFAKNQEQWLAQMSLPKKSEIPAEDVPDNFQTPPQEVTEAEGPPAL